MKIIFITWWVVSGLGKGISSASIWRLLESSGYKINMLKIDPYLQVDAGTMSPYEHWEVFVTDDGAETDLDIWNYERFTWLNLTWENNITTWQVYLSVITKERKWDYLGKTVQVIPHITNEIKDRIKKIAKKADITIVEVWWTVWDMESLPFFEAIRQMKSDLGRENIIYAHVAPLLYLWFSWEFKTKPIQHSVTAIREVWIQPDILICRSDFAMKQSLKDKISLLCDVEKDCIIEAVNAKSIYQVPVFLEQQNIHKIIQKKFWLKVKNTNLKDWKKIVEKIVKPRWNVTISIVWKYAQFKDCYMSLLEAFQHAWAHNDVKVNINWIQSDDLEVKDFEKILDKLNKEWKLDWMLVPWGFWSRWVEWKINAIKYAREKNIPYLWICLGLQTAVIEFARNICWLKDVNSTEFKPKAKNPIVSIMESQKKIKEKWWTMRLWAYPATLKKGSLASSLYNSIKISERHRHRFEVNPKYHQILEKKWLIISWKSPDWKLVEFVELKNHPYFIATQAHPEFKSKLVAPHPLFDGLVKASIKNKK